MALHASQRNARARGRGFTLVELLVVITVLGVLAGVVVFAVSGISDRGQQSACATDQRTLRTAIETYNAKFSTYPVDQAALVSAGLLSQQSTLYTYAASGGTYTLTATGSCVGAGGGAAAATTTTAPPPVNINGGSDMFANATVVPQVAHNSSVIVATNVAGATTEAGEPWIGGAAYASVWFAYTPTTSSSIRITTTGYTNAGAWIGLYRGSVLTSLTTLQQVSSRTAGFTATVGNTYRVQVFTQSGHGSAGTVTFADNSANGDAFVDAIAVAQLSTGGSTVTNVDVAGASTETGEPWIGGSSYASVWLSYTPTTSGSIRVTTSGYTAAGAWIGLYQGSVLTSLTTLQQVSARVAGFTATVGNTYRIQVFTQVGQGTTGTITLSDNGANGDSFVNAIPVTQVPSGGSRVTNIDVTGASTETGEPWIGGSSYASVWLSYTPTSAGSIRVTTSGYTSAGAWIGLYRGSVLTSLTTLQQVSARVAGFTAAAGSTYRIQVFTQVGQGTTGTVTLSDNASNGDSFADAIVVAPVANGSSSVTNIDVTAASTEVGEPWIGGASYASVWLAYTPTVPGSITLTTAGYTSAGTWIGVYRGSVLTSLTTMQQVNSRTTTFAVTAGNTYRFQIFTQVGQGTTGTVTVAAA